MMETKNTNKEQTSTAESSIIPKMSKEKRKHLDVLKPSNAFHGASWVSLFIGMVAYCIGLWNAEMELNEKGYYFTVLLFGLFSVISVQKSVRDKMENIPVTDLYYGISWFTTITSITLLIIGLWNSGLLKSEIGFYAMSFTLALFSCVAVQKSIRDTKYIEEQQ